MSLSPGNGWSGNNGLRIVGLALALVLVVALTYRETPGNQFQFDDYGNIVDYAPVRMDKLEGAALLDAFSNPKLRYRNVPSLTFAFDWWRGGGEARAFLQTNVLLHMLAALAVFAFALQVLQRARGGDHDVQPLAAFCVASLWAVHPINSQAVNLIVQRMAILAALFVLLSLISYLKARSTDSPTRAFWYIATALFGSLAALSKENAWILPLLLLATEYGIVRHGQALVRSKIDVALLSLPIVVGAFVVLDLVLGDGPISRAFLSGYEFRSFTMEERLLTQPRVVFFYLSLVLWPMPERFSLEHDFALSTSLVAPPTTLLSILGLGTLLLAALLLFVRPQTRLLGFVLLWPAMTLAVESSFIPLEIVFEHRMYLPMVGIVMLPGLALTSTRLRPPVLKSAIAILIAVSCALAFATAKRTGAWKDPLTLSADAVAKAPGSSRAWSNLGMYRYLDGDRAGAIAALEKAIELSNGKDGKALELLGAIHLDLGDTDRAASLVGQAYRMQRGAPEPSLLNHMGEVELARERYAAAAGFFGRAIGIAPWKTAYYWNIALAYEGLGECDLALQNWRRFLAMEEDPVSRRQVEQHIDEVHTAGAAGCRQPREE